MGTLQIELSNACILFFLFAFRVPSETLHLMRGYSDGPARVSPDQSGKALIGARETPAGFSLVGNRMVRRNLKGGCVIRRPRLCPSGNQAAISNFPAHALWPAIRARVPPMRPLFSAANVRNFNRILRAALGRLQEPDAKRYSAKGFRRGAAQELKETGSPRNVVAADGLWRSAAFRGYVDLSADVEQAYGKSFDDFAI